MPYIGRSSNFGVRTRFLYTATASQTTFSGTDTQNLTLSYFDSNFIDVHQNGVLLKVVDDYTATSGTSVVLATGATASDVIEITVYDVFSIANHIKKTGDAMAGALTNIDIDGTELVLDADGDTSITADTDDQIDIKTGGSDRVIIDSSGNVLVGRTSTISGGSNSASGAQIGSNGLIQSAVSGDTAIALQRLSDDGDIIQFRKDTTQVGSIGTANTDDLYIINDDTGLMFSGGSDMIIPRGTGGASRDNAINLGAALHRFKDLYLSGGLYVGGTGSTNQLDDYEEGTWTPAVTVGSNSTGTGNYKKIGGVVFLRGYVTGFTNSTNNETLYISGLPFTTANNQAAGSAMWENINDDFKFEVVYVRSSDSRIEFFNSNSGSYAELRHIHLDGSNAGVHFNATYLTDQ